MRKLYLDRGSMSFFSYIRTALRDCLLSSCVAHFHTGSYRIPFSILSATPCRRILPCIYRNRRLSAWERCNSCRLCRLRYWSSSVPACSNGVLYSLQHTVWSISPVFRRTGKVRFLRRYENLTFHSPSNYLFSNCWLGYLPCPQGTNQWFPCPVI